MKQFDVCGVGNALLDILVKVEDEVFETLDLEKATMRLVEEEEQKKLLKRLGNVSSKQVSGGSVANSIIAAAQLGAKAALLCRLGEDIYGNAYSKDCASLNVMLPNRLKPGLNSGTCLSIITPDAERTMRTCLGASSTLGPEDVSKAVIQASKWFFIEGYLLANGDATREAIRSSISYAKEAGTRIAFTVSESWVVSSFPEMVEEILGNADLVFCNASEACSLTNKETEDEAFETLSLQMPGVAVTAGGRGAFASWNGTKGFVESFPCAPVDLTGAGDIFAGTFLYGIARDFPVLETARRACYLASEVISHVGARLQTDAKVLWERCH